MCEEGSVCAEWKKKCSSIEEDVFNEPNKTELYDTKNE
jgi:hypothetical protein